MHHARIDWNKLGGGTRLRSAPDDLARITCALALPPCFVLSLSYNRSKIVAYFQE